jgi:hypothetical protein
VRGDELACKPDKFIPSLDQRVRVRKWLTSGEACRRLWALATAFQAGVPPACPVEDPVAPETGTTRPPVGPVCVGAGRTGLNGMRLQPSAQLGA